MIKGKGNEVLFSSHAAGIRISGALTFGSTASNWDLEDETGKRSSAYPG